MKRLLLALPLLLLFLLGAEEVSLSPSYNVQAYGAKGDGIADDTAAIQACIDAALGAGDPVSVTRLSKGPVYLPSGTYRISKPLRIYSAEGFKLHGDGFSTRLLPVGTLDSVLDLNGIAYSIIEGFSIQGAGRSESVTNAVHYYWDRETAYRSSTANTFRDITVSNTRCVTGFRVGKPGDSPQIDNTSYSNLYLAGGWVPGEKKWYQAGFHLGTGIFGNILGHHVYQLTSSFWSDGVRVDATNYAQWGGGMGQNGTDYQANTLAYFTVQGVRSETSGRFFESRGRSTNDALYSLADIIYSADRVNSDGEFLRLTSNGNLSIRNLQICNGGEKVKIAASPQISSSIKLDGVNTPATLEQFTSGLGAGVRLLVSGYYQSTLDGGRVAGFPELRAYGSFPAGISLP